MSDRNRQRAFDAGKKAALEGKSTNVCNRQRGTIFFDDWHDGYEEGKRIKERSLHNGEQ